jgi:UDP-N-acetylglucosamine--N-acetylmuramyl-(pentapeptide) pyrophosphoryl-undecaprenol N-acetylglucosamine transferase
MPMSVVIAGGGTGGHIEPALALADALRRADPSTVITCLGTERGLETRLVPARGYDLALIPPVPLPRSLTPQLLAVPGKMIGSVTAARWRHVPIMVHEANCRPGLANKIGARLSRDVFTGQHGVTMAHSRYIGIPLRRQITGLDRLALGDEARAHFGLRPDLPVLLVTGGSQGARAINNAALGAAGALSAAGIQVLHVVGPKTTDIVAPRSAVPYVVLPYLDRMDLGYAAADFALCRAGAMTCAELTAVGLPAGYVPLPHGNGEQRLNALPIEQAGGGLIVADADLTPDWIERTLLPILLDAELVAAMSKAAAATGDKDADQLLADEVYNVVSRTSASRGSRSRGRAGRGRR